MLRSAICLCISLACAIARAQTGPAPSAQRYDLDVVLDPVRHELEGREVIRFQNPSPRPLHELYLHLYLNAFADEKSVFVREGGLSLRDGELAHPGGVVIDELRDGAGRDLLASAEHELVANDRTQLKASLPEPLAPGATLELHVRFRSRLPNLAARSGFAGDFHMVAQFFPKLARLEPDGRWASFPYHGLGEFYADFAHYTLRVRAPERFVIAAPGTRVAGRVRAGQRDETYVIDRVCDVAFAAYPHFVTRVATHDAVRITFFAPPGYELATSRQLHILRAALTHFAQAFGPYPYTTLTVILPPRGAHGASGMEYPAMFVSDGEWWALPSLAPDPLHDHVVAHELAHQWFGMLLASNEVEHPMLDEGLAEWATFDFLRTLQRSSPVMRWLGAPNDTLFEMLRALYDSSRAPRRSSLLPAYRYDHDSLAHDVYARPALVLHDLETRYGRPRLLHALGRYTRTQRFGHPTPDDLFAAFDASFGPGFSARELRPALTGQRVAVQRGAAPSAAPASTPARFMRLLLAAQALLHWLGA